MDEGDVVESGQFGTTALGGSPTNQEFDRFRLSSYNNSVTPLNAVTVMRNEEAQMPGLVGVTNILGDILPETEEELQLHMQLTYKQEVEIAEEQALNVLMLGNDYELIKKRFYYDLTVLGIGAVKTNFNTSKT
jgi:hypothetical protein